MQEGMGQLKTTLEESNRTESLESTPPTVTGREIKGVVHHKKEAMASGELQQEHCKSPAPKEDKVAKIERLKSGFRICKPQGSFLWPNMAISAPHGVVQLEDLFAVPTPPSVSSTSAKKSHLLSPSSPRHGPHPTSPAKPLAEKGPVTIPLSTVVTRPISSPPLEITHAHFEKSSNTSISTTTFTTKTPLINLNEPLDNQSDDNGFCGSQSHSHTSPYPVTYQRRHHQNGTTTTTTAMPCVCTLEISVSSMLIVILTLTKIKVMSNDPVHVLHVLHS